jgi:hypothetical protein
MNITKIILVCPEAFDQCLEDVKSWLGDEDYNILNEREVAYIKELVCQQDDSHELVHQIIKKLGGYI